MTVASVHGTTGDCPASGAGEASVRQEAGVSRVELVGDEKARETLKLRAANLLVIDGFQNLSSTPRTTSQQLCPALSL